MAARIHTLDPRTTTGRIADSAPVSGWRRVLRDGMLVSGATVVCHLLGTATSLILRMLLSPAQMGIWQALKLFLSYGNYANLGVSKGAVREFTVALGSGQTQNARRGLSLAFTVNTLSSLAYAAVLIGSGLWIGWNNGGNWQGGWALGLIVAGSLAVLSRFVTFHVTILRSQQAFVTTSQLSILEAVLTLGVCGLATWRWGLPGLYGGTLVVMLASLAFVLSRRTIGLQFDWHSAEIRRLIAIGGPILLAGTVSSLFRSLDKLMILGYLPDREFQLGCYSLTLMVTAQLYGLGNMFSTVMGPRYGEKYGRSKSRRAVAQLAARATELHAAAIALPAAVAIVAAPAVLMRLLPDYQTGLAPLVWLIPGVVGLTLALPASQYLIAVDHQRRALAAVLAATGIGALGNHLALTAGFGLSGLAAATGLAYAVYLVLLVAVSIWLELNRTERLRYLGVLILAIVPTLGLALTLEHHWPGVTNPWTVTLGKTIAVTLIWILTTLFGWNRFGWRDAFRNKRSRN